MLIREIEQIGLIIIPAWLEQALKDNNKPISSLLDLEELKQFLTLDDIAKFFYLNRRVSQSTTELAKVFINDFVYPATSPYSLRSSNSKCKHDFKYFEDIELAIDLLFKNVSYDIEIGNSVKSNLIPPLQDWELSALINCENKEGIIEYGLYSFNTFPIHNNVYGIRFSTELGEDSTEYRTYVSLDNLLKNISQYYDFRNLVGYKTFQTYLKYMDYVN